ncbi:MAG: integration host factor subunit alpha [Candidatus Hydrothermota bacterium]|nr:MAG: integration host factor subunit alpha [Candidatus Hydrothermae bacterium]
MNKQQLVSEVAKRAGISKKDAAAAINAFVEVLKEVLANKGSVRLVGFGTFSVRQRAPRKGRNPRTKEVIEIPARYAPVFKPSNQLRQLVNK